MPEERNSRATARDAYVVAHTTIDGVWNEGQWVTEAELREAGVQDVQRLRDVGALRRPTEEEREAQALIEEREETQRRASEDAGRSEVETAADVAAQSTRGDLLTPPVERAVPAEDKEPAEAEAARRSRGR